MARKTPRGASSESEFASDMARADNVGSAVWDVQPHVPICIACGIAVEVGVPLANRLAFT